MPRRWAFYIAINVLVSAATMLLVLVLWDRSKQTAPISVATLAESPAPHGTGDSSQAPTSTPYVYVVIAGDTLSKIAQDFGVELDELAAYNNIVDIHALDPGMRLIIPPGARAVAAAAQFPTVTPQPDEPFPWPIVEDVLSPGDLANEAVRIKNPGPTADLTGWILRTPGGREYAFRDFALVTLGALLVHTGEGTDSSIDLYWGAAEAAWNSGDEVFLLDAQENLRAVFLIP